MDEDRTSLSGTHSNDTIIELTGASVNEHLPMSGKDISRDVREVDDPSAEGPPSLPDDAPELHEAYGGPKAAPPPPAVTPGLLILDLLKLKKRKIGHRRVNEEGEITFKKIQTSWIVGSIQLGIGHAIGSLASKPERDLLMMDFTIVETTSFPQNGSHMTPAHRFSDFKFRAYAPVAFRHFRDLFGIRPDDFLLSLCDCPMVQLANPGASGSIFYVTDDDNFIIKTVDHREAEFLQKLLPGYYMNINQNPRTLLPKFFGLYCYQCSNKNVRLVVMNNLLPSVRLHEKYDLKGSTYKRRASKQERRKTSPTYKDLDYLERHPDGILLEPETYSALVSTMRRDCRVLESFKIMDYSLLVGVHNLDAARKEKGERLEAAASSAKPSLSRSKSMNRQRLAAFSTAMESIRADVDVPEGEEEDVPPGGIPARNSKGERLLLFLGVIDILQSFVLKKKLEHTLKAIVHDGDTVSVHRPGFYAQRFLDFMCNTVFRKAPSPLKHTPSKRKSGARKTSGVVPPRGRSDNDERDPSPGTSFEKSNPREEVAPPKSISLHLDVGHPEISKDSSRVDPAPSGSQPKVTWAETEIVELSQVIIETEDTEVLPGMSSAPPVAWTPPHSAGGSTPTHTEGTPSLTESSPSPTTPLKGVAKSFDSLGPLDETRVQ